MQHCAKTATAVIKFSHQTTQINISTAALPANILAST